jgi:hypothetical protein
MLTKDCPRKPPPADEAARLPPHGYIVGDCDYAHLGCTKRVELFRREPKVNCV